MERNPYGHDPREPVLLSEGEYERLRTACSGQPMLSLFVPLVWETGSRSGELLQLEWSDVDFEGKLLRFVNDPTGGKQTKGRRSRVVPLSGVALAALREHAARFRLAAPKSEYVFKHLQRHQAELVALTLAARKSGKSSGSSGVSLWHPNRVTQTTTAKRRPRRDMRVSG